ncbi:hypothetical protein CANINC_004670 [Pichia inconspicua]|uniref:Threonine/serine exporter-like N-terminal domain-containing protein n=1 Tax=Pichia inconspicua TaxID=52247 RepID=A0A4T0WWE2_9ASCO|nr:hypothetical protein CANINC_004670 [[Candida] inconspicua]
MFKGNKILQQNKKEKGHKRSWSTQSANIGSSGFSLNTDSLDLNSLSSGNSFTSLRHLSSTNLRAETLSPRNSSFDSLNSLPDYNSITTKNTSYYKNKTLKQGKKLFKNYKGERSKKTIKQKASQRDANIIIEDDESESVLNVPVLPAFEKNAKDVSKSKPHLSTSSPQESTGSDSDSKRNLRTTLDTDFDFNFTKDAVQSTGDYIMELRKKKGLPIRRPIQLGSSSDDTSTEGEESEEHNEQICPTPLDNDSVYSGASQSSKKHLLKGIFRRRHSLGSIRNNKRQQSISDAVESIDLDNLGKQVTPISPKSSREKIVDERRPFEDNLTNSDTFEDEKSHASEKVESLNEKQIANENPDLTTTGSNGENFLKGIFHLNGLLGQGGLVPSLNVSQNVQRGSNRHDEENPPPNFVEEIKTEAQALVGSMLKIPFDSSKRKRKMAQLSKGGSEVDVSEDENSTRKYNQDFDDGMYVSDNAHLSRDPFDDLQDVDNFIIDVPEALQDKPRRLRTGIQSSLLQMYNSHVAPPSLASATESSFNDSNANLAETMSLNLGSEIKHLGEEELGPSLLNGCHKANRKAASLQEKFTGKKPINSKRKETVAFEMPDFGQRPQSTTTGSKRKDAYAFKNLKKRANINKSRAKETTARITVHIADVLERQRFILTLCKAFMLYGAPTHRLEEYMSMTSQVLEIDGSFIYFPGCMLVSFGDLNARTSEMKLVRCAQGLDLGKLDEVHDIYKNVVHDRLGTVEGYKLLDEVMNRSPKFNKWWCVLFYALSSLAVSSYGFGGSWIDMPICFAIGGIIGFLQFVICPKNSLYSSVFEVTSSIIASFIARAIGSINGGNTFCYAAIVQSPLALILPGYIILCGSLELQSRNIVAGSVRMFYAFIYSLMLSFGITLGAALYGWIDENATSTTTCTSNISPWFRFLFVPMFTIGIALTNQASFSQLPMMVIISSCGYVVTYFSSLHFKKVTELNATLGCFVIGLISNIYSRFMKSFNKYFTTRGTFMTVSLMLPAIFVQVPSGIASQGSVFTGINTANNIVHNNSSEDTSNSLAFGMVMIQVALGISVGLYLSTIIVYPFGKKKTGLFTL